MRISMLLCALATSACLEPVQEFRNSEDAGIRDAGGDAVDAGRFPIVLEPLPAASCGKTRELPGGCADGGQNCVGLMRRGQPTIELVSDAFGISGPASGGFL